MFDIGFWELVLIAVVGLLVLGPERLPAAVRTVSRTIGTIKRYGAAVRDQVEQELQIEQLHQDLKKAEALGKNVTPELQASLDKLKANADSVTRPYAASESKIAQAPTSEQVSVGQEVSGVEQSQRSGSDDLTDSSVKPSPEKPR